MNRLVVLAVMWSCLSASIDATAQMRPTAGPTPSSVPVAPSSSDQIRAHAARIKEARALLDDREPSVRLAALDDMTNSNDAVMQEVAYEAGFSSADGAMRALALKRRLMHMSSLTVEVIDIVSDAKRAQNAQPGAERYTRTVTWQILFTDERNGTLWIGDRRLSEAEVKNINTTLTVSGLVVTISDNSGPPYCQGAMRLDDGNQLTGQMTCRGLVTGDSYNPVTVKVRARVV